MNSKDLRKTAVFRAVEGHARLTMDSFICRPPAKVAQPDRIQTQSLLPIRRGQYIVVTNHSDEVWRYVPQG